MKCHWNGNNDKECLITSGALDGSKKWIHAKLWMNAHHNPKGEFNGQLFFYSSKESEIKKEEGKTVLVGDHGDRIYIWTQYGLFKFELYSKTGQHLMSYSSDKGPFSSDKTS